MSFFGPSGALLAGKTTCVYTSGTDTLSGTATNADGSPCVGGAVRIAVDPAASTPGPTFTTTTDGSGNWSKTGVGGNDGNAHSFSVAVDTALTANAASSIVPAFQNVHWDGSSTVGRITSGGVHLLADIASPVGVFTGGVVTSFTSGAYGNYYEPGVVQTVTKSSGSGSSFAGTVAARADGRIYGEDINITNGGTGFSGTVAFAVTRKVTKFIMAAQLKLDAAAATNDFIINWGLATIQLLTGYIPRFATSGGAANVSMPTLGSSAYRRLLVAVDFALPAASGGIRASVDDTSFVGTPTAFVQGSTLDFSASASPTASIMGGQTLGSNMLEGTSQFFYAAAGYPAIDSVTGNVPDISQQTVRDRFLSSGIGLTNGSGPTGRQPQIFIAGAAAAYGTNKGRGNNFVISGTPTDA